jgi:hypothetical protein
LEQNCHSWRSRDSRNEKTPRPPDRQIAQELNNVKKWNSHGIGISAEVLRREFKLLVDDFGANQPLNDAIRAYHRLLSDYMGKMNQLIVVHTREAYEPLR